MNNSSSAKPRALVAEDDRALADIIRLALTRAGFDVTVAFDGQQALQASQATRFDLVVSDYQMPLVNGKELLSAIRQSELSADTQLILCSAKSYEINSERLRDELGLTAIFYKPFSLNELISLVRRQDTAVAGGPASCS